MKSRWENEPDAGYYLDYIYEVIQRRNNLLLHSSPTAFRQTFSVDATGKRQLNRTGPDSLWTESFAQGAGGYYFVCRVLTQEFDFERSLLPRSSAPLPAIAESSRSFLTSRPYPITLYARA